MRRWRAAALLAVLLLSVTGCWSRREINELAIVVAVGWDYEPGPEPYRVTMQIARVGALVRGGAAQGQQQGSPVEVITGVGRTPLEAARLLQRGIPRRFHVQHNELWVIGEELARREIGPLFDHLDRSVLVRPDVLVLVAKGPARDVLQRSQDLEKTLAQTVTGLMHARTYASSPLRVTVNDLGVTLSQQGRRAVIPGVSLDPGAVNQGKPLVMLSDLAVFRKDRMVAWMPAKYNIGFLWAVNKVARGVFTIPCPDESGRSLTFEVRGAEASRRARLIRGRPAIGIHTRVQTELGMQECSRDLATPEGFGILSEALEEALVQRISEAVEFAQEQKSDVFGFGEVLHRNAPAYWRTVRDRWDEELFPDLEPAVTVDVHIRRAGLTTAPVPVK